MTPRDDLLEKPVFIARLVKTLTFKWGGKHHAARGFADGPRIVRRSVFHHEDQVPAEFAYGVDGVFDPPRLILDAHHARDLHRDLALRGKLRADLNVLQVGHPYRGVYQEL